MTQEITSEDVADWMQIQLAKAHKRHKYANIDISIWQYRGNPTRAAFSVFHSSELQSIDKATIEECFAEIAEIAGITPAVVAAKKRAEAASLMEEADKLEQEGTI